MHQMRSSVILAGAMLGKYLYISIRQKEYLLKSDITEGSVEELRQILTDNLGDKFKSAF